MQGNIWIKTTEKGNLKSIKPTMDAKTLSRILEISINLGNPVILEDANETFDPLLEPLLGKQIEKLGSNWTIKLGDGNIEYSKDFRFYISTKLSKPHYAPEVCVKVSMLNFMVTESGLEEQMLVMVVTHEDPKNMDKYKNAIKQKAENKRIMAQLEDTILN
jgi:dynein heavy chain